jgi:elongation factor Ts
MAITAADVKKLRDATGAGMSDCKKALEEAKGDFAEAETILKKMGLAAVAKRAERGTAEGRIFTAVAAGKAVILELGCETDFVARNADLVKTGDEIAKLVAEKGAKIGDATLTDKVTAVAAVIKENITLRRVDTLAIAADEAVDCYLHGEAATVGVVVKFKLSAGLAANDAVKTFMHDIALHAAAFKPQFLKDSLIPADYLAKQKEIFEGMVAQDEKLKDKPANVKQGAIDGKLKKLVKEICFVDQPFVKDDKKTVAQMCADIGKASGGSVELVDFRVFTKGEAIA